MIDLKFDNKNRLVKSEEEQRIKDSMDPFLLFRFNNSSEILDLLEKSDYSYQNNDNVYFLKRLAELDASEKATLVTDKRFKRFMESIKVYLSSVCTSSIGRCLAYP
jgi:hypothetical protein